MAILQINEKKHKKKFPLNGATFGKQTSPFIGTEGTDQRTGFCVTRVLATTTRLAWATKPQSIPLGLVSTIFFYAGVVLLFIANLFFAQRIVRAQHPHIGWSRPFKVAVPAFIAVTIATIICLIVAIVTQFETLNDSIRHSCRDILLYGATFYALMAFLPLPVVIISTLARQFHSVRRRTPLDKFGEGSMRAKVAICLISGFLLALGALFRATTTYLPQTPILTPDGQPVSAPWYLSKGAFYGFNFAIEAFIVWFWVIVRIDKRFIVPNGADGPYSYAGGFVFAGETGNEKRNIGKGESQNDLIPEERSLGRNSWNASRRSLASGSRVSWGGISRDDIHAGIGEDGIEITPYVSMSRESLHTGSFVDGVDQEMGWDPKNGKWALRPISVSNSTRYGPLEH